MTSTKRLARPGVRELPRYAATDVVALNGTGEGEQQEGLALVLAGFSGAALSKAAEEGGLARSRAAWPTW